MRKYSTNDHLAVENPVAESTAWNANNLTTPSWSNQLAIFYPATL
jgi:hypothetical protein